MEKTIRFKDCCERNNPELHKLLKKFDSVIYKETLNWFIKSYYNLRKQNIEQGLETMAVVSFLEESIDTFDAIWILHSKGSVRSSFVLLRKLLEMYFQISFLLKDDCEEKALAYEAYYESRTLEGGKNSKNMYSNYSNYTCYKEEADKAYKEKPKYLEWYQIYDNVRFKQSAEKVRKDVLNNIKMVCKKLGGREEDLYEKYYSIFSKAVHGVLCRDFVKYNEKLSQNYIENFRYPKGLAFQTQLASGVMYTIYEVVYKHYSIPIDESYKEQLKGKIKKVWDAEEKYFRYHS